MTQRQTVLTQRHLDKFDDFLMDMHLWHNTANTTCEINMTSAGKNYILKSDTFCRLLQKSISQYDIQDKYCIFEFPALGIVIFRWSYIMEKCNELYRMASKR